jgi:hypothetical protein
MAAHPGLPAFSKIFQMETTITMAITRKTIRKTITKTIIEDSFLFIT